MSKPSLVKFNQFAELLIQKYERYLPTAYDENMSLLQKVNKVIVFLGDVGKLNNKLIEQWNTVMEWVMNDGLDESVTTRLNTMMENGEFDTLINQTILGSKARIIVSAEAPTTADTETFWYKETSVIEIPVEGGDSSAVIISDDAPENTSALWLDIE